jgi:hypothetical protein
MLPILIPPIGTHDKEGGRVDIPEAVSHLPLNSKVDVMDRATGRVLTGDQAISVVELAKELRNHASYEPLVVGPQGERYVVGISSFLCTQIHIQGCGMDWIPLI